MSFVCVDIGASSTRYINSGGSVGVLPNNIEIIEKTVNGERVPDMDPVMCQIDSLELQDNLEIIIEHPNEYVDPDFPDALYHTANFPIHAMVGSMAKNLGYSNITPVMAKNKTGQIVNFISWVLTVAVSRLQGKVDEHVDLHIALPPKEVTARRADVPKLYGGEYTVHFVRYNQTVKFYIDSVECFPESSAALTSFMLKLDGTPSDNYKAYGNKCIMSVDIGASTSDFILMEKGSIVEKTGRTFSTGGITAMEKITTRIQQMYSDIDEDDALNAAIEGRINTGGGKYTVVSDIVNDAKRQVASTLVHQMDSYLRNNGKSLRNIDLIVVSGGGSLPSSYVNENNETVITSKPVSEFFVELLSKQSDGVDVKVVNHSDNPRMANLFGLYIRARLKEVRNLQLKREQSQVQQTQAQPQPVAPPVSSAVQASVATPSMPTTPPEFGTPIDVVANSGVPQMPNI